jgi:GcrA cell cycle regulator
MMIFNWTQDRVDEALRLSAEGKSASEIGALFGISRNAVIGKLHRLRATAKSEPSKPTLERNRSKPSMTPTVIRAVPKRDFGPPPSVGNLASIVDVTGCRYAVREDAAFVGGQAFCNCAQRQGSSYCDYHHHLTSVPYKPKLDGKTLAAFGLRFRRKAA